MAANIKDIKSRVILKFVCGEPVLLPERQLESAIGICPSCHKPVFPSQGYHTVSGSHWSCHVKAETEFKAAVERLEGSSRRTQEALAGLAARLGVTAKPVKRRVPRGEGSAVQKLKLLVAQAFENQFKAQVTEVQIYLNPPVWNRPEYDVTRFQGGVTFVPGSGIPSRTFDSWYTVTQLVRAGSVALVLDAPVFKLVPGSTSVSQDQL